MFSTCRGRLSIGATQRKVILVVWCIVFLVIIGHLTYSKGYQGLQIFPKAKPQIEEKSQITHENPNQPLLFPPPKYERLYEWEKNLPQHDLDLPYPEGKTGRYVKFTNQIRFLGWNNVFNEL